MKKQSRVEKRERRNAALTSPIARLQAFVRGCLSDRGCELSSMSVSSRHIPVTYSRFQPSDWCGYCCNNDKKNAQNKVKGRSRRWFKSIDKSTRILTCPEQSMVHNCRLKPRVRAADPSYRGTKPMMSSIWKLCGSQAESSTICVDMRHRDASLLARTFY